MFSAVYSNNHLSYEYGQNGGSHYYVSGLVNNYNYPALSTSEDDAVVVKLYSYQEETAALPALGHDLVHHDAQAATCTAVGWDAYDTCSRCDSTTYVELPATGHTVVVDAAVAPTCTDTGLTGGSHCSVCNEVLVEQTVVPALGHSWNTPTYTWSADNSKVTATRTCAHNASHTWRPRRLTRPTQ